MTIAEIAQTEDSFAGEQTFPPQIIMEGAPTAKVWTSAEFDTASSIKAGIWSGDPGKLKIVSYPTDEVFTIISGSVAMHCDDGTILNVKAGQSCLMRKGWSGTWHVLEPTTKSFVSFLA